MAETRHASALNMKRKQALDKMDLYFEQEYPFSEDTYEEYERLEKIAAAATEELMKYCDIQIRRA